MDFPNFLEEQGDTWRKSTHAWSDAALQRFEVRPLRLKKNRFSCVHRSTTQALSKRPTAYRLCPELFGAKSFIRRFCFWQALALSAQNSAVGTLRDYPARAANGPLSASRIAVATALCSIEQFACLTYRPLSATTICRPARDEDSYIQEISRREEAWRLAKLFRETHSVFGRKYDHFRKSSRPQKQLLHLKPILHPPYTPSHSHCAASCTESPRPETAATAADCHRSDNPPAESPCPRSTRCATKE